MISQCKLSRCVGTFIELEKGIWSVGKMTLKVYVDYASQPSRALPLFFKAAKIPHEVVFVHIVSQDHKSEKITKLNPFQTVPFVEHDGKVLGESMAILRYITKALDVEDHWYPKVNLSSQCSNVYHSKSLWISGCEGWTKSQRVFTLATFGHSLPLRHVLPGRHKNQS